MTGIGATLGLLLAGILVALYELDARGLRMIYFKIGFVLGIAFVLWSLFGPDTSHGPEILMGACCGGVLTAMAVLVISIVCG